ncbi:MAG: hypothetical protein NVS3B21_29660 [Acidimicrobiales bacterium]
MLRRALLAAVVAGAVSACATSGTTYVSSPATQTFVKLPRGWKVFNQDDIRHQIRAEGSQPFPFLVAFDADAKPSIEHSFRSGDQPWGIARVRDLGMEEHDHFSLASLRNELVKVDDLAKADPNSIEVLATPRFLTRRNLRGTRLEYTVHGTGTDFTVSQSGFVDQSTRRVWLLILGCEASCYKRNATIIHRVVDSWTVEGK